MLTSSWPWDWREEHEQAGRQRQAFLPMRGQAFLTGQARQPVTWAVPARPLSMCVASYLFLNPPWRGLTCQAAPIPLTDNSLVDRLVLFYPQGGRDRDRACLHALHFEHFTTGFAVLPCVLAGSELLLLYSSLCQFNLSLFSPLLSSLQQPSLLLSPCPGLEPFFFTPDRQEEPLPSVCGGRQEGPARKA